MKRFLVILPVLLLTAGILQPPMVFAADAKAPAKTQAPGVEVATAISTITGVAISPLFGAGAVGAYRYHRAGSNEERARLPWFAQPWFFIPALIVVGICALKDVFGIGIPTVFKKPFDVLETVEHKVSGLVAAGAFVPMVASVFHDAGAAPPASLGAGAMMGHGFLASADISRLCNIIAVPVAMLAFFILLLASNAINILILLSPFGAIDAALKSFRLFILSTVTVSAFANPYVGAAWSLVIILLAWLIAGWSFRLSNFGMVYVWEVLTFAKARFHPRNDANEMFLGRTLEGVPTRTFGKLTRNESGDLVFQYKPWLFLHQRTLTLPAGKYFVGRGLVYSEIECDSEGRSRMLFLLPPRYRSHEEELCTAQGLDGTRAAGLLAAWAWIKDLLGFGGNKAAA